MIEEEIEISTRTLLRWRCIESRTESKRLLYGRFAISPFRRGQANTVGIAMRRALLDEIEGASITSATIKGIKHEYSAINGIRESIHDILINLKEIILRSDSPEPQKAYISVSGPSEVTARDIQGSSLIHVIDHTQYIATITGKISLDIELDIEKDRGYRMENSQKSQEGFFPIDAVFMPIRNANYSVHSFGSREKTKEILLLEIWTDGSLTPEKALYEASRNLIDLFIPSMNPGGGEKNSGTKEKPKSDLSHSTIQFVSTDMEQMTKDVALKHIFIDQLELPARAYNCLKRVNVHTVADLLDYGENDLMRIKNFGKESIKQVSEALKKRFLVNLPKNKNYLD
nr:RNA polymerase alpha subunit [Aneura pinguis]WGO60420.1 RNA polymerase alpha subunit [Aneura pinguis]